MDHFSMYWLRCYTPSFMNFHLENSEESYEVSIIVIPILQMKKPRLSEATQLISCIY